MTTLNPTCKKRIMGDLKLLKKDPPEFIDVCPDETNLLIWNFLIKGPPDSPYEGGYYIGQIIHSPNYPFSPPDYHMLTPSGRFEVNRKICLTNSGFHTSDWSPMWNIHSLLMGFLSNMLEEGDVHNVAHLNESIPNRKKYAKESIEYNKKYHQKLNTLFTRFLDENGNPFPKLEPIQSPVVIPEQIKTVSEDKIEVIEKTEEKEKIIEESSKKVIKRKVLVDIEKIINEPIDTSEYEKEYFDEIQKKYNELVSKK